VTNGNFRDTAAPSVFSGEKLLDDEQQQEPNVVICGGGPAGLLASVLLNNAGIKSTVVEQATETKAWGTKSYTMVLNDKGQGALERGGCLEAATEVGQIRPFIGLFNPTNGEMKRIPKKSPNLAITRHLLVRCLEEIVSDLLNVTVRKGVGVSGVTASNDGGDDDGVGLRVDLEDGTSISATHVIGADGKWSNVRRSIPSFLGTIVTCPSAAISMHLPNIPEGWESDSTYLIKPTNEECKFYIIVSALPKNQSMSLSMVYYDQTVEKYPWLAPPMSGKLVDQYEGWDGTFKNGGQNSDLENDSTAEHLDLSDQLKQLFEEELPAFSVLLNDEVYRTAVMRRRATWLKMKARDGQMVTYSSEDGRVSLIGDAAHAMTASTGEGCNTALESCVDLVENVISTMKEKEETSCTVDTMSLAFTRFGTSRPKECISVQELAASKSMLPTK